MAEKTYLAVDLGASSGRVVAGRLDGSQAVRLEEVHRFDNGPVTIAGRMVWDLPKLWSELLRGLQIAGQRYSTSIQSVGVDSWGVDFALLGRGDELLGNPYHYRDRRTDDVMPRACSMVSREEIFEQTGLQFMQINTLYQLLAMKWGGSPLLEAAESLLMIPDLFHWLLCGEKSNEQTDASTTQFYNPNAQTWATSLLDRFDLPRRILGPITPPGSRLGKIISSVADATGLTGVEVVAPAAHDTASAVLAVPADGFAGASPDWCYISSGTWSLMGVELSRPVINDDCLSLNFTNEAGVDGTTRLLKNIAGLWLVQECRRIWAKAGNDFDWPRLVEMAEAATPVAALIDPNDPSFLCPANMPEAIVEYCRRTKQTPPSEPGGIVRCALESLALGYRRTLDRLERLVGGAISKIHVVGGGSQNELLCQMTADACRRTVIAGPAEATALGNVLMQAKADGQASSIADVRRMVRESFAPIEYQPRATDRWDEAFARFENLRANH